MGASDRWTVTQVDQAAPDDQIRRAARHLAIPTPWNDVGVTGSLLYGRCQGSGKTPYQVSVEIAGPRYKCTCPSRKFPCKHSVALLYLWAEGHVDEHGVAAAFASEWADRTAEQPVRRADAKPTERTPDQDAAALQRIADREARVDAGLADLSLFLSDQLGRGLAHDSQQRPRRLREQAARMVDAQAPGVAGRLDQLAEIPDATTDWPVRLTEGIGRLHLLIRAWQNRASLPDDLAATVRSHVGFTVRSQDVLATPGVRDTWVVLGLRDSDEDRVSVRRVWLRGLATHRPALVMFFAAGGAPLVSNLYPGTALEATLHFYPGRPSLRAAVGDRAEQTTPFTSTLPDGIGLAAALAQWRDALAADPWIQQWPLLVTGELRKAPGKGFGLADEDASVAVIGDKAWPALAVSGGWPCTFAGEFGSDGFRPSAVVLAGRLVVL
jgi:hypothetical protein